MNPPVQMMQACASGCASWRANAGGSAIGGWAICWLEKGLVPNHKKLLLIYREEGLKVRRRGGRKRALGTRAPMTMPQALVARLRIGCLCVWTVLPHPVRRRRLHARVLVAGGGHVAVRRPGRAGAGWRACRTRQAADGGQRQWHLDLDPALVAGAAHRMALHRARQAHAERLCGIVQRQAARRMSQRDAVHLAGARQINPGCLEARLQHGQAALETGWAHPRRSRRPTGLGACPQPRCHPINHQPSKQRTLLLNGTNQGCTSSQIHV